MKNYSEDDIIREYRREGQKRGFRLVAIGFGLIVFFLTVLLRIGIAFQNSMHTKYAGGMLGIMLFAGIIGVVVAIYGIILIVKNSKRKN